MSDTMTMHFKSSSGLCMAAKPREAFIVYVDKDGKETGRKQIGEPAPLICTYCGKLWSEHNK